MMGRAAILSLLLSLAAGCGAPSANTAGADGPVLAVEQAPYPPGATARLRLTNPLAEPIGYNACTWTLERRHDDAWQTAPHEDERMCTMELRTLAPGATARPAFRFDERLPGGLYRLRATLHRMDSGSRFVRHSAPFRIEP